jgi:uncharacterized protein YpmS
MKKIFTLIILFIITINVNAQIGAKKSKIIEDNKNYKMEVADDGTDYITCTVEFDNYNQFVACYLTDMNENKEQFCYRVLMIEPSSETNNWIKYFNDKNFVKLNGMTWKDYEHSIVY